MTASSNVSVDPPKNQRENLEWRDELLEACEKDMELAQAVANKCAKDILYFFNTALWTFDPRTEMKDLPFITYPYQDEYILWLRDHVELQKDALTEKSRDMGATWLILGTFVWFWLFDKGFNALLGTYIEDLVDNFTIDSLFGRLDYMINLLPNFMKPEGLSRSYMKIHNPIQNSLITGYAPTDNFSRQGRYKVIFLDEFAFWTKGRSAWKATADAAKCRLPASTVNGKSNKFAELALKTHIDKKTLHWTSHPGKTPEWYENEKQRRTPEEMAQEIDINYNVAVRGRVYPEFGERNYIDIQAYKPLEPLFCAWDFGLGDETSIIWLQLDKSDNTVRIIDAYQNSGKTIDFYVPFITGEAKSIKQYVYTDDEMTLIEKHKHWQPAIHYGDPTGNGKNQVSGTSVIKELKNAGIMVNVNWKKFDLKSRIHATKLLIRRLLVDKDLLTFIDAIENSRYPERKEGSQATTPITDPVHDWTSHYRTALEYYAVNENLKGSRRERKETVSPTQDAFEKRLQDFEKRRRKKKFSTPSYRLSC